jgi:hypothetical protein
MLGLGVWALRISAIVLMLPLLWVMLELSAMDWVRQKLQWRRMPQGCSAAWCAT